MTSGFPATFRETLNGKPGLNPRRLIRLMEAAIDRCHLDLRGQIVLTEAASGAYVVTPVLAAMAGAQVLALAATTSYATSDELRDATTEVARLVGMAAHSADRGEEPSGGRCAGHRDQQRSGPAH
jgi:hypothetical protein